MPLRNLIFHNFWLKLFSVALASVIWMTIHFGIQNNFALSQQAVTHLVAEENVRVPVTVVTSPGDSRVFKTVPDSVIVTAVGEELLLPQALRKGVKVYIDMTDCKSNGPVEAQLHLDVPHDITVVGVRPPVVSVQTVAP